MTRFSRLNFFLASLVVLVSVAGFFAQTRPRPAGQTTNDFKVTYRTSMGMPGMQGQASESTTMIKGARQRSESRSPYGGYSTVDLLQCDLKRSIQMSETTKKYVVTALESDESSSTTPTAPERPATGSPRRGGVVTYTSTTVDTGERKEMFGFTARHVKSTTVIESSPDACNHMKHKQELDGWYIDLNVGLNCLTSQASMSRYSKVAQECQDQTRFRRLGTGKVGFPLIETMKMYGEDGQVTMTTTKEVIDLSRQTLDQALFEIPAGYTEAASSQELYAAPSMASIMAQAQGQTTDTPSAAQAATVAPEAKKPGSVLVGVVQINNRSGRDVSAELLRQRLIGQLQAANVEAVALNALSQMEAQAEAKAKQCDFILFTDLASLKTSKLGMFGSVTGVGGAAKTEAKVEFKLFAVGESAPKLQSTTSAKEEGDEASAGTAIDNEARMVSGAARKKN